MLSSRPFSAPTLLLILMLVPALAAADTCDTIGGDDVAVVASGDLAYFSMDIADDGTIFAAVNENDETTGWEIIVYRSTDDGETFAVWSTLSDPDPNEGFLHPYIDVVEGVVDAVNLAYQRGRAAVSDSDICLISSPIGVASAAWGAEVIAMSQTGVNFIRPRFATDVASESSFNIYLVATGADGTGTDIFFARSTDQGASFETHYRLASLAVNDRGYGYPEIAYGFGGHLHVVWHFYSYSSAFDMSVRYRRGSNSAAGGVSDWDNWITLTSTSDGYDDLLPQVAAGAASNDVVIAFSRQHVDPFYFDDTGLFISDDTGLSFEPVVHLSQGPDIVGALEERPDGAVWYMVGYKDEAPTRYTANPANLAFWGEAVSFLDAPVPYYPKLPPAMAFNPTKNDRTAVLWNQWIGGIRTLYFDTEWFSDMGWPNYNAGFPVDIPSGNYTPIAIVDVDNDTDAEIVFSSEEGLVHVYKDDGTPAPGWPVDLGRNLSPGGVAVGDLNNDGYPLIVVGGANGEAYALDHEGNLMPGWPTTISGPGKDVYVSIGALGGIYHRTVVCVSDNWVRFRNRRGVVPQGAVERSWGGTSDFLGAAAIGDIDLDGVAEVVCARHTAVFAMDLTGGLDFVVNTGRAACDAPTLGDLDLDGDLEIVVPTDDGYINVLDHLGASMSGYPMSIGGGRISSVAIADNYLHDDPELTFITGGEEVHSMLLNGSPVAGYPITTAAALYPTRNTPVIERVNSGTVSSVVVGTTVGLHAWSNVGVEAPGWPKLVAPPLAVGPAAGKVGFGSWIEYVALTDGQLHVIGVHNTRNFYDRSWPMYGHDPQRTGCSDCPEDVVTAVELEDNSVGTKVFFAAPSPNPAAGLTRFSYEVPTRAVVSLDVYDVRGRRVDTVVREEFGPGRNVQVWDGRDRQGRALPSGVYYTKLRVRGPGVNEEQVRKVTLVR